MRPHVLAVLFLIWLPAASGAEAAQTTQTGIPEINAIKERVLMLPAGSLVEVTLAGGNSKVKGRLGSVDNDGFELTPLAPANRMSSQRIAFGTVRSIKTPGSGMRAGGRVALIALASVGAAMTALLIYIAAAGGR